MLPFVWMTALFAALALRRPPGPPALDRSPEVVRRPEEHGGGDREMFLVDTGRTVAFGPSGRRAARRHGGVARRAARRRARTVIVGERTRLRIRPLTSREGDVLAAVYVSRRGRSERPRGEDPLLRRLAVLQYREFRRLAGGAPGVDGADATVGGPRV